MEDFNHGRIATPTVPSEKNAALIAEVKKFPALYDVRDPDYYILARRNEAWLEVARNCGEPGIIYCICSDTSYNYRSGLYPHLKPTLLCALLSSSYAIAKGSRTLVTVPSKWT